MNRWLALFGFVVLCLAVAGVAGWLTRPEIGGWYASIRKPTWNPPSWVFGPVWTTLYVMMAVAGWLVWQVEPGSRRSLALSLFGIQLALNFIWSPLFFKLHQPGWAALEIVLLWLAIGGFTVVAWGVARAAAFLFIPYWAWVTFATALNFAIWMLNVNAHQSRAG